MTKLPVNLLEFEAIARGKLPAMVFGYYVSGSDDQVTLRDNREAFNRIRLRPHYMRGVEYLDTTTNVLGHTLPYPFMVAPMGFMAMAHPDGELAMARATTKHNIPMVLSTMSNYKMEDVAAASDGLKLFQLYIYNNRAVTEALVKRAENAGFKALVLTVDVPVLGRREADIHNGFHLPEGLIAGNLEGNEMKAINPAHAESGLSAYINELWENNLSWEHLDWLKSVTDMPILLKGILRGDDAQLALEHGVDGIIVSNHGGRQLDTAPAPIDVLQEIVDVVDGRVDVLMDGGVRRGTDIIKALAMGAKAVLVGRPMMYALAYDGEAGVNHALDLLTTEFETAMRLCGTRNLTEITPDLLMY